MTHEHGLSKSRRNNEAWALLPTSALSHPMWATAWQWLTDNSHAGHPALDIRFVRALVRYFGNEETRLAVHTNQNTITAMLLIEPYGLGRWSVFAPANAVLPLAVAKRELNIGVDRYLHLLQSLPGLAWMLGSPCQDARFAAIPPDSIDSRIEILPHPSSIRVCLNSNFEHYWSVRDQRLRENVARRKRGLTMAMPGLSFRWIRDPGLIPSAIETHAHLEESGWKGKIGSAINDSNLQKPFYREIMCDFACAGEALVGQLVAGSVILASQFILCRRGMAALLKTAYDPRLGRFGPGRLLLYEVLRHLFNEPTIKTVEFCTQASSEDQKWSDTLVEIHTLNCYRNSELRRLTRMWREFGSRCIGTSDQIRSVRRPIAVNEPHRHPSSRPMKPLTFRANASSHDAE